MSDVAAQLLAEAEEQIEAWLCGLDAEWKQVLADAHAQAADIVALAESQAAEILAAAEADAAEVRALAAATRPDDAVGADDLAALAQAVERLRLELSRVVEAAFDALPAVEATAAALRIAEPDAEPAVDVAVEEPSVVDAPRRRGLLARITRRA